MNLVYFFSLVLVLPSETKSCSGLSDMSVYSIAHTFVFQVMRKLNSSGVRYNITRSKSGVSLELGTTSTTGTLPGSFDQREWVATILRSICDNLVCVVLKDLFFLYEEFFVSLVNIELFVFLLQ